MSTNNGNAAGPGPGAAPAADAWVTFITPFATTVGKTVDEVTTALEPIVGKPGDQAIALLKDASMSPDVAIKSAFQGVPLAVMNLAIKSLRGAPELQASMALNVGDILPEVPNEQSWLQSLRAGGALKVSQNTVTSAIRASLAKRVRLFDVIPILVERMETWADQNAEQVGPEFFKLRKEMKRREYAEVFEAIDIDGLTGEYVTERRKNELFSRIDTDLWPAILSFQGTLKGWFESWQAASNNPGLLMQSIIAMSQGGAGVNPNLMMQVPDTGVIRDAADSFADTINKVFAGTRMPIAIALASEAGKIVKALDNPQLPMYIGAANRDQMLRQLGVDVTAQYPRMETNLIKYVMSIMKIQDVAAGTEEQQFFSALYMLGNAIPWDQLQMGARTRVEETRRAAAR